MAIPRERPYSAFRYLVDFDRNPTDPKAGFQEVTGLGVEITMQEYRAGNAKDNAPQKIAGLHKVTDVSLKRGVLGELDLTQWLHDVRTGKDARRDVTIQLQNEEGSIVMSWELKGAQPMKYTGPSLNGKGTDVAIEELALSVEYIEFK